MTLTPAVRKRLDKLATYLEGLPEDYAHFSMDLYVRGATFRREVVYARRNGGVASCGSSACAAGHGPAAGILVPPRFIKDGRVEWDDYAGWLCGDSLFERIWCFGGLWDEYDNHHYGAAARIRSLLDRGAAPRDFRWPAAEWLHDYAPYRIDAPEKAVSA